MPKLTVLWELFLIFALARAAGELLLRLRQPAVVGELLVGVAIGPHALGWVHRSEVLQAVAEIGLVFLLFQAGLDNRYSELRRVGPTATAVAFGGALVPFAAGTGLLLALGHGRNESLFLGVALASSSVGTTARVLGDLGMMRRPASQVILGAAVIDDVLGLLLLAAVTGIAAGNLSGGRLVLLGAEAVFFLVFIATVGTRLMRRHGPLLGRLQLRQAPFVFAVAICLGLSALAERIGLAAIVGAFQAGMVLAEGREHFELEQRIEGLVEFLAPYFFVLSGMIVDVRTLARPNVALLTAAVFALAVVTKVGPGALASLRLGRRDALIVGTGLIARREVALIAASIGLGAGVLHANIYAVVVAMTLLTTIVVPPALGVLQAKGARP